MARDSQTPDADHPGLQGLSDQGLMKLGLESADPGPARAPSQFAIPDVADLAGMLPDLEIIERVGIGGMGCVFTAHQKRLDRTVALKVLPRELGDDPHFAERFAREARALARMNHPNIVTIHDFGEVGGQYYLVMEYMDGMNLRELMDSGDMTPDEVIGIFKHACAALQYAHREGVVHRDIKPENILFDRHGHVKLADFGLARLAVRSSYEISLTATRQAMGTLHYMAPEQWENPKEVDHRADVYALGILLYEMLTGRVPRGSFEPPSRVVAVDPAVDEVVIRALQTKPDDRYQNVEDLSRELERIGPTRLVHDARPVKSGGTFTRFVAIGARAGGLVRQAVPKKETRGSAPVIGATIAMLLAGMLSIMPWSYIDAERTKSYASQQYQFDPIYYDNNALIAFNSASDVEQIIVNNGYPFLGTVMLVAIALLRPRFGFRGDVVGLAICILGIIHFAYLLDWNDRQYYQGNLFSVDFTPVPIFMFVIYLLLLIDHALRVLGGIFRFLFGGGSPAATV